MVTTIYFWVASIIFVSLILATKWKKLVPWNNISVGVGNITIVSILWPVMLIAMAIGFIYDAIETWKRI